MKAEIQNKFKLFYNNFNSIAHNVNKLNKNKEIHVFYKRNQQLVFPGSTKLVLELFSF